MSQLERASTEPLIPGGRSTRLRGANGGSGRLEVHNGPLDGDALAALFPDFSNGGELVGLATWAGSRQVGQVEARAASLGLPALALDCGLLRIPPWREGAAAVVSVTAVAISGPASPADMLCPVRVLATPGWEMPALLARAAAARRELVSRQVGGSWWHSGELPAEDGFVLVDAMGTGPIAASVLRTMLQAALAENAARKVVILAPHPFARSDLLADAIARGATVLARPVDPWAAIVRAERVYAAGGEIGFLALLAGRAVHCFDESFYSGWGPTLDDPRVPQRSFRRTVDEIFAGACLVATRYLDPYRKTASSIEQILSILADWRPIESANRRVAVLVGMSFWKRRRVTDFFRSSAGTPVFRRTSTGALKAAGGDADQAVAVWASRMPAGLVEAAARQKIALIRVEDGFIRSVGLGSDFVPAASLVLDRSGMHYDPGVRSELELLLLEAEFDAALIARASALIDRLVARGITKYNLRVSGSSVEFPAFEFPPGRRRILVPGQVEDDLSVRLGGGDIRGNLDLLACVRAANPDAFILYKPHPDVEAGHRTGAIPDRRAREFADRIVRDISTAALLGEIDELHTLTSLAGFEALLRGRRVVVYGRPFYGGWGLTADVAAIDRGRRLALEELVAGALILYPRYLDPVTRLPCSPEIVLERLDAPELWRPGPLILARRIQGLAGRAWRRVAGIRNRASLLPRPSQRHEPEQPDSVAEHSRVKHGEDPKRQAPVDQPVDPAHDQGRRARPSSGEIGFPKR
jgi:capsular polysaccharide export protein